MSLLNQFMRVFGRGPVQPTPTVTPEQPVAAGPAKVHVMYPPVPGAIPMASAQDLMDAQQALIKRLLTLAATLSHHQEDRFLTPIRNLANHISNIPGSKDSIYGGPGGLFRACLECAFFSYQASGGRIFTGKLGVEERHRLEARWCYICFLSGLIFPLGLTLEKIRLRSEDGDTWISRAEPLTQWAQKRDVDYYFLMWPKEPVEPGPSTAGSALALSLAGEVAIRFVEEGGPALITAVNEISSNLRTPANAIAFDVVTGCWGQLVKNEMARLPQNYGRVSFGQHIAPMLVDAMRECIAEKKWEVNSKVVLADSKGVYLIWPQAAKDMLETRACRAGAGLPHSPSGLLQTLIDERLVHVDAQQSAFLDVADSDGELHMALRLVNPESCVEGYSPEKFVKAVEANEAAKKDPLVEQSLLDKRKVVKPKPSTSQVTSKTEPLPQSDEQGAGAAEVSQVKAPPPPAADILMPTIGELPVAKPAAHVQATSEPSKAQLTVQENKAPQDATTPNSKAPAEQSGETSSDPQKTAREPKPHLDQQDAVIAGEAPSINRSAYELPDAVATQLGKQASVMFTKVIKDLEKPEYVRMIISDQKDFVGIPLEAIEKAVTSPVDLLIVLQKHGWLHPDIKKPRAMIHTLSTSNGGSVKCQYVMLTKSFVKKAALPFGE
jgi:conjugal transfer pilus assembly protein TraI